MMSAIGAEPDDREARERRASYDGLLASTGLTSIDRWKRIKL